MIQVHQIGRKNKKNDERFGREAAGLELLHGLWEHDVRLLRLLRPPTAGQVPSWSG